MHPSNPSAPDPAPLLVRACRGEAVERAPVWIMRQAGRYLPEYQAVRARHGFVEICQTPRLAAEITLQPVERLGVDAAIVFNDILLPLRPMGAGFDFDDKPRLDRPIRTREQIEAIRPPADSASAHAALHEALGLIRQALPPEVALIGFCGAPFTLANYLIEGGGSDDHAETKRMLRERPALVHALLGRLAAAMGEYLAGQVRAGAQVVQIFESSGGALGPDEYEEFALPYARRAIEGAKAAGAPAIFFPRGCGGYLERLADCGADAMGVDWQTGLAEANRRLGGRFVLQGNLDPSALLGSPETIERKAARILAEGREAPGFVFNLGHGILPATPPENARALVDCVKRLGRKEAAPSTS